VLPGLDRTPVLDDLVLSMWSVRFARRPDDEAAVPEGAPGPQYHQGRAHTPSVNDPF
jgi:hypothetical protein